MIKHIPNILTCGNALFGAIGIIFCFNKDIQNLEYAVYCMGVGAICDFLDGFVARLLHVSSPIGKELDSLADCITFGALPAFIVYHLLLLSPASGIYLPYVALIIVIFSVLRLAKFNVDTRQSDSFIGVPTPANAILIASLPLIIKYHPSYSDLVLNPIFLISLVLVMSVLLVSELPLFALKFKSFAWKGNQIRFLFLIVSVLLLIFLQFLAIPLVILCYILFSVADYFALK